MALKNHEGYSFPEKNMFTGSKPRQGRGVPVGSFFYFRAKSFIV